MASKQMTLWVVRAALRAPESKLVEVGFDWDWTAAMRLRSVEHTLFTLALKHFSKFNHLS